jgi:hypothetical protein
MPDSKSTRAPEDASRVNLHGRINLHEHYEVDYWTKKFGVDESELRGAVTAVGSSAKAVEAHLKKKK